MFTSRPLFARLFARPARCRCADRCELASAAVGDVQPMQVTAATARRRVLWPSFRARTFRNCPRMVAPEPYPQRAFVLTRTLRPCVNANPADATVAACGACHNVVTFPARQQMAPPPVVQQQASVGSGHLSSAGGGGYGGASWSGAPAVSAAAKGGESRGQPARDDQWTQWPAQQSLGGGPNSGPSPVDWQQAPPLQRPRERRDQARPSDPPFGAASARASRRLSLLRPLFASHPASPVLTPPRPSNPRSPALIAAPSSGSRRTRRRCSAGCAGTW